MKKTRTMDSTRETITGQVMVVDGGFCFH